MNALKVQKFIEGILFDLIVKAIIAKAVAKLPFLALPILNPIFSFVVTKIASELFKELSKRISFEIIHFKTQAERKAYEQALVALRNAPDEDKDQKLSDVRASLRELIRLR